MSHLHVARLVYRLKTDGTWTFEEPPKVERQTDAFFLRLEDDMVYVSMREHHETAESARARVEKYLRSWEISASLQYDGTSERWFEFDRGEVLDLTEHPRAPTGTPPVVVRLSAGSMSIAAGAATAHVTSRSYPNPPDDFTVSEDVEVMWTLYQRYRQDHERLLTMAATCLSWLAFRAQQNDPTSKKSWRKKAEKQYNIKLDVLGKLGELTANLGVGVEARKVYPGRRHPRNPTDRERKWIEEGIKKIIRRVGERAADPQGVLPKITMTDLPQLRSERCKNSRKSGQ
jgi:hypothetical protein